MLREKAGDLEAQVSHLRRALADSNAHGARVRASLEEARRTLGAVRRALAVSEEAVEQRTQRVRELEVELAQRGEAGRRGEGGETDALEEARVEVEALREERDQLLEASNETRAQLATLTSVSQGAAGGAERQPRAENSEVRGFAWGGAEAGETALVPLLPGSSPSHATQPFVPLDSSIAVRRPTRGSGSACSPQSPRSGR